jgi:prolyl-tRNA editing enzyme YbaK/EbsC (Cys-tRNA(Pro) deacylase)
MSSLERVRDFLSAHDLKIEIRELPSSTRTAHLAADAVGAPLGSIVKSLVFIAVSKPVLVLVSGDQRADAAKIGRVVGATNARIANANEVREQTGYAIGGVPPVAHDMNLEILIDETLTRFKMVWAAAGTPNTVFEIETSKLIELTGGSVASVVEDR